jgi:succinyl-CoA synthetase alpha subunit
MWIDKNTTVIVQGITGKEGLRLADAMLRMNVKVLGGVRPGKGGEKVLNLPIWNTVQEAILELGEIDFSTIVVPPAHAFNAVKEALVAGIKRIHLVVERIPLKDTSQILELSEKFGARLFGPSSLGFIRPGIGRIGIIGGDKVDEIFELGDTAIISRSGGMTNELSWQVKKAGMGQSFVIHVGGDLLMGTTYADILKMLEKDEQTKKVILFGEHGGNYENEIVELIKNKEFTKPLNVYIGGKFASVFPEGMAVGHAGAIVGRGQSVEEKTKNLQSVGVKVVESYTNLMRHA